MKTLTAVILCSLMIPYHASTQGKMSVTTSKPSYAPGETIQVNLSVWNDGDTAFTINSSTSCVAWIRLDSVTYSMACDFVDVHLLFNPGDSRTWIWRIVPSVFGYPTYSGRHRVRGTCTSIDSAFFDAPEYRGGPLSIKFYPGVAQSVVDSIRSSVNATVEWGYADTSGIFQSWHISGFQVDSLAGGFSLDPRVKYADVSRSLSPDSLLVVGVPPATGNSQASRLYQNFPNPFNPSTTIRYSLGERSDVHLAVFNILGQKVVDLVQGTEQKGDHTVEFNGSRLPSGIYFCRLTAGGRSATSKIVLIR